MMKSLFVCFVWLICSVTTTCPQQAKKNGIDDSRIVGEYLQSVQGVLSPDSLLVKAALFLLNTPYVAHTLDRNAEEQLVVNLREMDCMTLVENCLALSRTAQCSLPDYDNFVRLLREIRYRSGILQGYTSRLHYTTEWITDNVSKGIIKDITCASGGKPFQPRVGYMSSHPERYAGLKNNTQDTERMKIIEQLINQQTTYCYIPKNEIKKKQSQIRSGDMICFTTHLPGLDISHVGIAYWNKGQLSFIHASIQYKKVIVNPESLVDYCGTIPTNTGIMVIRSLPYNNVEEPGSGSNDI